MSRCEPYLVEALALARRGLGRTWPNPCVGAVVERDGVVLGRGFHPRAGEPHAEVLALREAGDRARGATLHVTLEPCSHQGRTPPCADAVIRAGIARVVYGCQDPNPEVAGRGLARLRAAGIEVVPSSLESEARELISGFSRRVLEGRPEILLKAAVTLDGQLAPASGRARWITSGPARQRVHQMRDEWDGILAGSGTVLADDPALTVRDPEPEDGRQPFRIVLDRRGRVPPTARVLGPGSLVLTGQPEDGTWAQSIRERGGELRSLGPDFTLAQALQALGERGLNRVLVEGGATVMGAFLRDRLGDRAAFFYGPMLVGAGGYGLSQGFSVSELDRAPRIEVPSFTPLGVDFLVEGRLVFSDPVSPDPPGAGGE